MTKTRVALMLAISFALVMPCLAIGLKKDPFVGSYTRIYAGASGSIKDTLVLKPNMTCTLKSVYEGHKPIIETCTWSKTGDSAKVTFKSGNEDNNMTFKLQGHALSATEYNKSVWGAEVKYKKIS